MQAVYSQQSHSFPIRPILIIVFIGILAAVAVEYCIHANLHSTADDVRTCIQQKGIMQDWLNPITGRHAWVCQIDNGKFGLEIVKNESGMWKEVTSFIKDKMNSINQVMKYLENTGYFPVEGE